jgi:Fic family protein
MPAKFQINIKKVEDSLRDVQKNFSKINDTLHVRRDHMRDEIVENMLAGYSYVNTIITKDVSLLERAGLHHLLELNHIVLCGADEGQRKDFREHIKVTTDRFYQQKEFCISHIRAWAKKHKKDSAWKRAAGVYVLHVSRPQLFLEGNHRTGALLMSCILVRHGKPPFVLSVDNAKAYFDPSSLAKGTNKNIVGKYYKLPKIKSKFANFLEKQADERLLIAL